MGRKLPKGIVFYFSSLDSATRLSNESLGKVVSAAVSYAHEGILPDDFDVAENIIFDMLRRDVDNAIEKYEERCERNRINGSKAKKTAEETQPNQVEPNRTQSDGWKELTNAVQESKAKGGY